MPTVPSPPLPAEHADPTPAWLATAGGRTFLIALGAVIGAFVSLHTGAMDAATCSTLVLGALATFGGTSTAKKINGAWVAARASSPPAPAITVAGIDTAPADDDEPIVMHARDAGALGADDARGRA